MRKLAHISDLHFPLVNEAAARQLVLELQRHQPDVLVVSGDLTQRARRRHYQAARSYLQLLPGRRIVIPGNHDIPLFDVPRRFLLPLERYKRYIGEDPSPFHLDGELAMLGLNTARPWSWTWRGFWKDGRLSEEQVQLAIRRLGAAGPGVIKVLVTHHPFILPLRGPRRGVVARPAPRLRALEQAGVDLLLAGHLHLSYAQDVRAQHPSVMRSMLSIQAGSAFSTRLRDEPNAYNLITIDGWRLALEVRTWTGRGFECRSRDCYEKVDGVWRRIDDR